MNDSIDGRVAQNRIEGRAIAQIDLVKRERPLCQLLHTDQCFAMAVDQIVDDDHVMVFLEKFKRGVAADDSLLRQ